MATMSLRISDSDKYEADNLFKKLGITTNSAINMFIKQCIRMQSLPFTPTLNTPNQRLLNSLEESETIMKELKEGKRQGYTDTDSLFKELDK
ncbi:MAG: type II toxin-antitoxin system RelB/DinJ family antitoxin [Bacilli bacterium]|nr:type II toxin-antitoxin system RelB/DinJ family antitoxin [Bacilli bacterium]